MKSLVLIIGGLLVGCGAGLGKTVDPAFQGYAESFYQLVKNQEHSEEISIVFGELAVAGQCSGQQITIDQKKWPHSEILQRELVYHELTHCSLGRHEHSSDPASYMHTPSGVFSDKQGLERSVLQFVSN